MHTKKVLIVIMLLVLSGADLFSRNACACSCTWGGSFVKMAPQCPLVIRGIVKDNLVRDGMVAWMDVEVRDILCGHTDVPVIRVFGDRGWLCRTSLSMYPVGTEWILALNGPGSKPAMDPGYAISVCGEFQLRVAGDTVQGNISNDADMHASETMPLREFIGRYFENMDKPAGEVSAVITGDLSAGETFERVFGPGFRFILEPAPYGWCIVVRDERDDEDIARLTPPFHFVPNPREIEGWHFRNSSNTGPNGPGEENINAPGGVREFIFSPEVGSAIQRDGAASGPSEEEIGRVARFGRGVFAISDMKLGGLEPGGKARFERMKFEVKLTWPSRYRTCRQVSGDSAPRY